MLWQSEIQWKVLFLIISIASVFPYFIPTPTVKFYQQRGFEISFSADPLVEVVSFVGRKSVVVKYRQSIRDKVTLTLINGKFILTYPDVEFRPSETLRYKLTLLRKGFVCNKVGVVDVVTESE